MPAETTPKPDEAKASRKPAPKATAKKQVALKRTAKKAIKRAPKRKIAKKSTKLVVRSIQPPFKLSTRRAKIAKAVAAAQRDLPAEFWAL